uniref:Uncharacterized protein n=1 Tax=Arundo donax TaxID=35708 RepID=A0A0A9BMQ4_ARUDO
MVNKAMLVEHKRRQLEEQGHASGAQAPSTGGEEEEDGLPRTWKQYTPSCC